LSELGPFEDPSLFFILACWRAIIKIIKDISDVLTLVSFFRVNPFPKKLETFAGTTVPSVVTETED
jgi:hypothetical protein